jgi:diguanylate cyclase (GGDEF)-like protein
MKRVNKKKGMFVAIAVSIMVFIILSGFVFLIYNNLINDRAQSIENQMIHIEDQIDHVIDTNYHILKSFSAYVTTSEDLDKSNINQFLNALLDDSTTYIRNITLLDDTTIVWNYPSEAIGTDLAQVDHQRDDILHVKNTGETIFIGPVDLVQGGMGYIIRKPYYESGQYAGQMSIVIDSEPFTSYLNDIENEFNVSFKILSNDQVIYNKNFEQVSSDLEYDLDQNMFNWHMIVRPESGWTIQGPWLTLIPFIMVIISVLIGFKAFTIYSSHHKDHGYNDPLTGLYNRLYLYKYAESLLNIASINQLKIGVILIDISGLKAVNETYGRLVGDGILVAFTSKIKDELKTGQEVFRISGNEFIITLENIQSRDFVNKFADHIKNELENHIILQDFDIKLTIDLGVSMYPDDGEILKNKNNNQNK